MTYTVSSGTLNSSIPYHTKESIGQHEFTSLPRALFTVSGELLPCTDNSKLMAVLEDLPNKIIVDLHPEDDIIPLRTRKATVIDGMAIVQTMGKPPWVNGLTTS